MKRIRNSLAPATLVLLIALALLTGCYRPAAPDIMPTPSQEDLEATAAANATAAAEAGSPIETPTTPPTAESPEPTDTPTTEPTAVPTAIPTAVPTTVPPAPTTCASCQVTHVVQPGENMFRIALRYGTTVDAIASANGITNPALIYVGQKLIIPSSGAQPPQPPSSGTTYVVQPGDNLFRIALRYNMNYVYLAQYNGIANPSRIYVGQVLRIPPR